MKRATPIVGAVTSALLAISGCTEGLAFRVDDRISITSPDEGAEVSLPMTLRWEATDVDSVDSFAVYVDRAPVGPGAVFRAQDGSAYRTTERELVIERINGDGDSHRATIVLLDEAGRRIGESAFEVSFDVEQGARG